MQHQDVAVVILCSLLGFLVSAGILAFICWRRRVTAKLGPLLCPEPGGAGGCGGVGDGGRGGKGGGGYRTFYSWRRRSNSGATETEELSEAAGGVSGGAGGALVGAPTGSTAGAAAKEAPLHPSAGRSSECPAALSGETAAMRYLRRQRRSSSFNDLHRPTAGDARREEAAWAEFGLDPALYLSDETAHETSLGKLCVCIDWLPTRALLIVTVVSARCLVRCTPRNTGFFYVTLRLSGPQGEGHKRNTHAVCAACNPRFDRQFSLPCQPDQLARAGLLLKVKEKVTVGKPRLIGSCALQLGSLGDLTRREIWRDLQPEQPPSGPPARIHMSLSYSGSRRILLVGLIECRDLKVKDTDAAVYLRASIMANERTVKTKKTALIKEGLTSPSIREELAFHLAPDVTDEVYLFVLICAKSKRGSHRLLGKTVIGPVRYAQGSGVDQWNDCFRNQPSIVYQWHDVY